MQTLSASLSDKLEAIRQCRYFAGLEGTILQELAHGVSLARFERGEMIFWQDDPCQGLYIIHQGSVKLFKLSPQGREFIVTILFEGETFNEVPVFDEGTNPVNAAALEDSLIWVIKPGIIRQAMVKYPAMCKMVILNLSKNLRKLVGIIEELSFYQVTHRLARLLRQAPQEQLSGEAPNRLTQEQMAARLGTVREVVARSLKELERSGAIKVSRRQIEILDAAILRQWAQDTAE